jgi:hypothetical protein
VAELAWKRQMAPYQQALDAITEEVGEIVGRYQDQLAQMDAALQAELAPLQQRMEMLRQCRRGGDAAILPRPTPQS